jgi:PAS domain-containing protein
MLPIIQLMSSAGHASEQALPTQDIRFAVDAGEERFRRILDTIPGFVCTLSAAGELELVNRQVLEYFGKTIEDLKNWATTTQSIPMTFLA